MVLQEKPGCRRKRQAVVDSRQSARGARFHAGNAQAPEQMGGILAVQAHPPGALDAQPSGAFKCPLMSQQPPIVVVKYYRG
jgi:hypothetical protein